jgi:hypothetical protein
MTWDGDDNVGIGKMTIVESDPDEAINIKVTFTRPFEGGTNSDFRFVPKGDQTEVAWPCTGRMASWQRSSMLCSTVWA